MTKPYLLASEFDGELYVLASEATEQAKALKELKAEIEQVQNEMESLKKLLDEYADKLERGES